jgi:hypothetical protein
MYEEATNARMIFLNVLLFRKRLIVANTNLRAVGFTNFGSELRLQARYSRINA